MRFATRAIHAGQPPDPATGAIMVPIYQTSTYVQEELGRHKGYDYSRTRNPTRVALERNLAALEEARHGIAFASGMAAITSLISLLKAGDHVICGENVYGGTFRLFQHIVRQLGVEFTYLDTAVTENVARALRSETKLVFVETPTNPLLRLTDIAAVAELTRRQKILLAVDNTFMTPYFQRPLTLGADIVVHSTTKYLNGHSDMVGGVLLTNNDQVAERLAFAQNTMGGVPGPLDCWLVLRGTKTLALRMREHEKNALELARWLEPHPKVKAIHYPGLPGHPQHELARRQMQGFGGMISIETGSLENAKTLLRRVRIFSLAESLGGVESLISHPATMTHAIVPREERLRMGITDGLVRLSVGVEDVEDLKEDLEQALARV